MTRRFVDADYPSKKRLTETEMHDELRNGPDPDWFQPWAERGVMLGNLTTHGYGYIHVYSIAGSFQYDFAAWPTEEGLRYGLQALHSHHTRQGLVLDRTYPRCEECQGIVYFAPDQPPRLHLVIEPDDEPEAEASK